jgi:RimJ/RimL family protein N-acetyltransferase
MKHNQGMAEVVQLKTERVVLRDWRDDDLVPFAALNADPVVMTHFPSVLTREQSDGLAGRIRGLLSQQGWGLWAAEVEGEFVGFVGLSRPRFEAPFAPCVEIGWRLARHAQGRGLATEAAREVLKFALEKLPGENVVSFTVPGNTASRRVMEKIGLEYELEFDHPLLAADSPLRRHVLYRLRVGEVRPSPLPLSPLSQGEGES